jgi:L,D-peptidoglycan transpeptidase YkuD (ErfK/YbiS/YcfS/YnhG family)
MIVRFCYKGRDAEARHAIEQDQSRLITKTTARLIRVQSLPGNRRRGRIVVGALQMPCALGKGGVTHSKRESDGATPIGRFALRQLWHRADRSKRPKTSLPLRITRLNDGWCDAATHPRYNRAVLLPFHASHERMWRDDHVYDYVIEIGWNDHPVIKGRGSAIFFHLARPGFTPTEGCVAVNKCDMLKLLRLIGPRTMIDIT